MFFRYAQCKLEPDNGCECLVMKVRLGLSELVKEVQKEKSVPLTISYMLTHAAAYPAACQVLTKHTLQLAVRVNHGEFP